MREQTNPVNPYDGYALQDRPAPSAPEPVTKAQRWLLLGAACIGLVFQAFMFDRGSTELALAGWYAAFWAVYLLVFHLFCWRQARVRPIALPFGAVALFLCVMLVIQAHGYSDEMLLFLNLLAIPALLMLHAQAIICPLPPQQESGYFALFLQGFFVQPFRYLPRCFAAVGSLFKQGSKQKKVWLGLLIAIPVVGVVLALLLSADAVMRLLARNLFAGVELGEYVLRGVFFAIAAMLFYSFLYSAAFAPPKPVAHNLPTWEPTAPRIVVGTLLAVYALFTGVQFLYLFGGYGLPAELTYSEYAREGFWQLIWVAGINLAVFGACLSRVREDKLLKGLLLALLCCTGVILASAFTRLWLYVAAYDFRLTFKRIQAFWMLGYISIVILLCAARLFKPKLPLLRWSAVLLALWYAALNIPDLQIWY